MRCEKYNIGNELPTYIEHEGYMVPCIPGNFEKLGVLERVDAIPEANKIITQSHGELINGEWIEIIDEQFTEQEISDNAKLARHVFTRLQIRDAFIKLGMEETLNTLLEGSDMFSRYWLEAQEIDLNHPVTVQAMNGFSPEEIEAIILAIV